MANINDLGSPQIANKAFVPLAIEAGIETLLTSLIPLAVTERELVIKVVEALAEMNPPLAAAWNIQTQRAVLKFLATKQKTPFSFVEDLPDTVNESGPASVVAARDGGTPTQVNVTFSDRPANYKYALYLDGVFQKVGNLAANGGFVNEALQDIADDQIEHTIRVLFVTEANAITLFGPVATFS